MRRSPYVLLGTAAGMIGILSFHTSRGHLVVPSASGTPATGGTSPTTTGPGGTTPTTAGGSSSPSATASPSTTAPASGGTRTAAGSDVSYPYGDLAVTVTVDGSHITGLTLATLNDNDPRSAMIDQQAIPMLRQQILAAGNLNINGVSGATFTSQAYVDSVQSALDKLGVK